MEKHNWVVHEVSEMVESSTTRVKFMIKQNGGAPRGDIRRFIDTPRCRAFSRKEAFTFTKEGLTQFIENCQKLLDAMDGSRSKSEMNSKFVNKEQSVPF